MLAAALVDTEDELRADLQQHYGIDLDHAMAGKHTPNHLGALIRFLPSNSNLAQSHNQDASWTRMETIQASLLNNLRGLIWGLSDKKTRGPEPTPLGPSWLTAAKVRSLPTRTLPIDELLEQLERPRSAEHGE